MMKWFQKQPRESSGNVKTTLEKEGRDQPDDSLNQIAENLLSYIGGCHYLKEIEKEIEEKYNIKREDNCWPENDIKQAWEKTKRLDETSLKRKRWALAIFLQVIKIFFKIKAAQSNQKEAEDSNQSCAGESMGKMVTKAKRNDDSNTITTTKKEECPELLDQSLGELCVSNKENVKGKVNGLRSTNIKQVSVKEHMMVHSGADSSGNQRENQVKKRSVGAGSDSLPSTFSEIDSEEDTNEKYSYMTRGLERKLLKKFSSQTVYIRIPLSVMSGNESTCKPEEVENESPTYKLIDRVPNLTDIRKKKSYVMLHDNRTRNAAWVYEILNMSIIGNDDDDHQNDETNQRIPFKVDNSIHPFYQAPESNNDEFFKETSTLYDRGHLAAAANHRWCQEAYHDTYLISNMAPQNKKLNRNPWSNLENSFRKYIKREKKEIRNIHVYTGPLYLPMNRDDPTVNYKMLGDKAVPTHFFKVMIVEKCNDTVELKCYQMPNDELFEDIEKYEVTIEAIEKASGLIFRESSCNQGETDSMRTVTWRENEHVASTQVKISNPCTQSTPKSTFWCSTCYLPGTENTDRLDT